MPSIPEQQQQKESMMGERRKKRIDERGQTYSTWNKGQSKTRVVNQLE